MDSKFIWKGKRERIMDYYWNSEGEEKLRELIGAESIENGEHSLSLVATYIQNGIGYTSESIPILDLAEFTQDFSTTIRKCVPNIETASKVTAILTKKNISSGIEEQITISNPPFMGGKKI